MPDTDAIAAGLRLEVGRLRQQHRRRTFATGLHLGRPGGERTSCLLEPAVVERLDLGMRIELVTSLLMAEGDEAVLWLARPGPAELLPSDLAWLAAARVAAGQYAADLAGVFAVTRYGWVDVLTARCRVWQRLRLRNP